MADISNIVFTKSGVNIHIGKAWTGVDRLSIIWKSDLSDKIGIFPSCSCVTTTVWLHYLNFYEILREKAR